MKTEILSDPSPAALFLDSHPYLTAVGFMLVPLLVVYPTLGNYVLGEPRRLWLLVVLLAGLAVVGFWLFDDGGHSPGPLILSFVPLYQIAVVGGGYHIFLRLNSRPPADVMLNFQAGLFWDRLYAIVIFLMVLPVPMVYVRANLPVIPLWLTD
jgi:hypothetical protein